jgi:hypothetical protein
MDKNGYESFADGFLKFENSEKPLASQATAWRFPDFRYNRALYDDRSAPTVKFR